MERVDWGPNIPPGFTRNDMWRSVYRMPWDPAPYQPAPANQRRRVDGYGGDSFNPAGLAGPRNKPAPLRSKGEQMLVECLKTGLSIAAGIAGFAVGGPVGAMVAGSVVSGSLTAISTKQDHGQVDWTRVVLDGFLGALPGVGNLGAKAASRLVPWLGRTIQPVSQTVLRGIISGGIDAAVVGGSSGFLTEGLESKRRGEGLDIFAMLSRGLQQAFLSFFIGSAVGGVGNGIARQRVPSAKTQRKLTRWEASGQTLNKKQMRQYPFKRIMADSHANPYLQKNRTYRNWTP